RGLNINARTEFGETALMAAARAGNLNAFRFLLAKGADTSVRDNEGKTLLMHAATGGSLEIVKLLRERGAGINDRDRHGYTALIHALGIDASEKHGADAARFLIEN